jgi:hypothetical protein
MIAKPSRPTFDGAPELSDELDEGPLTGSSIALFEVGSSGLRSRRDGAGPRRHLSEAAERCISRFAAHEADLGDAELVGLGRISAVRFPRLGGVLHGRVAPGGRSAALVTQGVERTLRAGYHAALATDEVAQVPVERVHIEDLWTAFVPASYRIPRPVAAKAWEIGGFEEYWVNLLVALGLDGDANRLANGHVSPLSRSIRGLSTVGVALALTERGGRHERSASRRQPTRRDRRVGRELPPAPRPVADDV